MLFSFCFIVIVKHTMQVYNYFLIKTQTGVVVFNSTFSFLRQPFDTSKRRPELRKYGSCHCWPLFKKNASYLAVMLIQDFKAAAVTEQNKHQDCESRTTFACLFCGVNLLKEQRIFTWQSECSPSLVKKEKLCSH